MHFEELLKKISPKLKGIVWRLGGRGLLYSSDDLYQEAMVHLWARFQQGDLSDKTDSYILQGCYFYLKNYIRRVQDKACLISIHVPINEEGSELEGILCLEDPKSSFDETDCKMLIEEILNDGLTKREKEVFCLALEGLTTREIGSRLGISHVRVVKLKGKIRDKCKKYRDDF